MRHLRSITLFALIALVGAGCSFFASAHRYAAAPGTVAEPFWCTPSGGTALSPAECSLLSTQLDGAALFAESNFNPPAAPVFSPYETGRGAEFRLTDSTPTFDAGHPDVLLYDGTGPTAQVVGIEYTVGNGLAGNPAPEGFAGPNDVWTDVGSGYWRLRVWILRPFQNQVNVFADSHPCLGAGGAIYDETAPCYTATHPNPLEVLVSNDDGYGAPGIDTIVEALRNVGSVNVTVSAPATNQSGAGSKFTDGPVTATDEHTASGYPAWAVAGYPVDAVRYALRTRHVNPDLVVSGTNNGQNIGAAIPVSGTIGAAREGAQNFIPALAISQGLGNPADFPASVPPLLSWLHDFLMGRTGRPALEPVTNINVPTCTAGSIRGTVKVPSSTSFAATSDCTSTVTSPANDVDAFANGFVSVSTLTSTSGAAS